MGDERVGAINPYPSADAPQQRGSSQSCARVQPKNFARPDSIGLLVFFCLLIGCSNDPYETIEGRWKVDISAMQEALTYATHAKSQAKAAAHLSTALLSRYEFNFKSPTLSFGQEHAMRSMTLEYVRTEKEKRFVFRTSDSPFLLRVTPKKGKLMVDFEDKVWHLSKR